MGRLLSAVNAIPRTGVTWLCQRAVALLTQANTETRDAMKIHDVFIVLAMTAMFGCGAATPGEDGPSAEADQALSGPPAGTTAHPGSMQLSATPQTVLGVTGQVN